MHTEDQYSVIFEADEVVIVAACRAIDLELVGVLLEHLHVLRADNDEGVVVAPLRHDEQRALAEELEVLGLGGEATALHAGLKDDHRVEVAIVAG